MLLHYLDKCIKEYFPSENLSIVLYSKSPRSVFVTPEVYNKSIYTPYTCNSLVTATHIQFLTLHKLEIRRDKSKPCDTSCLQIQPATS